MTNISRENTEHVERLTNMQLKLYLRQQSAKLSGNKAILIERVLNLHADGIFEIKRHHGEDDESMKPKKKRRTCLMLNQAKPVKMDLSFEVMFIFDKYIAKYIAQVNM